MISFFRKHKVIIFFVFLFLVLIPIVFYYTTPDGTQKPDQQRITPTRRPEFLVTPENISPLQKSIIGKTTDIQINKLPGLLKKQTLTSGEIKYSFESTLNARPNEIITRNGIVIFERELTPETPGTLGYKTISEMISQYGPPEKIIGGSKFYGWMINYYIYASRGFAFVGNENTGEIYEFNFFEPTTIDGYVFSYGSDISNTNTPPQE